MDPVNPLRAVAPTVDADVLLVLARTHAPLTGARVAALAERSYAQVRAVLRRLVRHGIVTVEAHGNANIYTLNRTHVAATPLEQLAGAADEVERRIGAQVEDWEPSPAAVVTFGSFARRDGDVDSDLDLLVVRPGHVAEDDPRWRRACYDLARDIEAWSGNRVQLVELADRELAAAVAAGDPLIASLRDDGRALFGPPLRDLVPARRGGR